MTEQRLIDANTLDVVGTIIPSDADTKSYVMGMEYILNKIDKMPTIEERKTGKWEQIEVSYFADMDDETKTGMAIASMFCPRCKRYHNEVYLYGNPTFGVNFCPNCGADMREQP